MPIFETSEGVTIHYAEAGAGRPLVFIHGWSMSGMVWRFQRELSSSFRLIAMDLRGHGQSTAPADGYAVEDFAGDLAAMFTRLDLTEAILVGWSMGVQVVLQAFPLLRSRLLGLVLVAGTPKFSANGDYPHGLPANEVKGMGLRLKRDYQKTMGDFFRGMFADGELDREQYQKIVHEIVLGGRTPEPEVARRSLQPLASADLRAVLPRIDLPVLLMHGSADAICLPAASRYMMEQMPNARLEVFEGVGHAPFLSRPAEFNRHLKGFAEGIYGRD
jgi:non-heme chloroperoxidase